MPFKVVKWGYATPLASGTCHCGQPMVYNLQAGVIGHTDPSANEVCAEPWPDRPNPAPYATSRVAQGVMDRAGECYDRLVLDEPTTAAPALGIGGAR
jgi:hypothetical protein